MARSPGDQVREPPAAMDPVPKPSRKRPLIYVYDLEPMYQAKMLQYRCVPQRDEALLVPCRRRLDLILDCWGEIKFLMRMLWPTGHTYHAGEPQPAGQARASPAIPIQPSVPSALRLPPERGALVPGTASSLDAWSQGPGVALGV